jgi:hypothetical protein
MTYFKILSKRLSGETEEDLKNPGLANIRAKFEPGTSRIRKGTFCSTRKIQVVVFRVVTPRGYVVGQKRFERTFWLRGCPKRWYPTSSLYGVTTQKTST